MYGADRGYGHALPESLRGRIARLGYLCEKTASMYRAADNYINAEAV